MRTTKNGAMVAILLMCMAFFGCRTIELTKRYSKATWCEDLINDLNIPGVCEEEACKLVTVEVHSYPITATEEPTAKGIFELSDHGQQAFIDVLGKNPDNVKGLLSALSQPIGKQQEAADTVKKTKFRRMIVFSVNKNSQGPANRIDHMELTLTLNGADKVKFATWDKIVTAYEYIDIGKLTLGKTRSFTFSPKLTLPMGASSLIAEAGSVSYQRTSTEEASIKDRLFTSGILADDRMIVLRKGAPNHDLNDNLIAEVEIVMTDIAVKQFFRFSNLFPEKDKSQGKAGSDTKEPKVEFLIVSCPNTSEPIKSKFSYEYVLRQVNKGKETFPESDDEVIYREGECDNDEAEDIVLVPLEEMQVKEWRVSTPSAKDVHMDYDGKHTLLRFASYADAEYFLAWLKTQQKEPALTVAIKIGDQTRTCPVKFSFGDREDNIKKDDLGKMKVRLIESSPKQ